MKAPKCKGCNRFMEVIEEKSKMKVYQCCGPPITVFKDEYVQPNRRR